MRPLGQSQGDAPVHDRDFAVLADHDVLRLDVAVDHVAVVGEADGVADLHQDLDVIVPVRPVFVHARVPRAALDPLHRVEQLAPTGLWPGRRSARCSDDRAGP